MASSPRELLRSPAVVLYTSSASIFGRKLDLGPTVGAFRMSNIGPVVRSHTHTRSRPSFIYSRYVHGRGDDCKRVADWYAKPGRGMSVRRLLRAFHLAGGSAAMTRLWSEKPRRRRMKRHGGAEHSGRRSLSRSIGSGVYIIPSTEARNLTRHQACGFHSSLGR